MARTRADTPRPPAPAPRRASALALQALERDLFTMMDAPDRRVAFPRDARGGVEALEIRTSDGGSGRHRRDTPSR